MSELRPESTPPAYPIQSVGNALRLLLLLRETGHLSVTESARRLSVAPSTAHRLLAMLAHYQFIVKDERGQGYRHGPALVGLAVAATQDLNLMRCARPFMEALASEVQETVTLILLEGRWVRFVDCVEGPRALRVTNRTGLRLPAHLTSVGKALLAHLPPDELDILLPSDQPLQGLTEDSITDRDALLEELEATRERDYATNFEESERDIHAVGVPIFGLTGRPVAGIGVSAPASRMDETTATMIAGRALAATRAIAALINQVP